MSGTGENEMGLRKIVDITRFGSVLLLLLHFYYYCYQAFASWELTSVISDQLLRQVAATGLFDSFLQSKTGALLLLVISLVGTRGRTELEISKLKIVTLTALGLLLFFGGSFVFQLQVRHPWISAAYMITTTTGFLLILTGGTQLTRIIRLSPDTDVFNDENETFPQEERLLQNEYSINLPAHYRYRRRVRKSYINIINPFRGLLVIGSPGAGKSWFVIQHVIKQHIEKGFGMLVYDFKFSDLSLLAYNWMRRYAHRYKAPPLFCVINFDSLSHSHRCNPLDPSHMQDITDATESARTILLGLNREWINKQGDFFVESPINLLTAIIWYLRNYANGKYCTLPHVIELLQVPYEELFLVLNSEPEIEVLINPFITAYQNDAMEQLEGQVASAKIGMARLSSPQLYWVLSGHDFSLDINNPREPKIVCMGNNPEKLQIYGAVLSLYISRLVKQVNKKGMHKCSLIFDEFPTLFFNHMDTLIATARSNKVATTVGMQDLSQLRKHYGKAQADVIMNITGNIISGQVTGDTARQLSERFGKIMQQRQSISVNRNDTSVSRSRQLDYAIPPSRIASLSSGEFVGIVADDPSNKIKLKMFHAEVWNDAARLDQEAKNFSELPKIADVRAQAVSDNYYQIKFDIRKLVAEETQRLKKEKTAAKPD